MPKSPPDLPLLLPSGDPAQRVTIQGTTFSDGLFAPAAPETRTSTPLLWGVLAWYRRQLQKVLGLHCKPNISVMTQNLYLGADLSPITAASNQQTLVAAATQVYAQVQSTNFTERADSLAEEISTSRPVVVGLQEAALWRSQSPADFSPTPNATHVEYDYVQILLDKLAANGTPYTAVATYTGADFEVPITTVSGLEDIRWTDRDVILIRADVPGTKVSHLPGSKVTFSNPQSDAFQTAATFSNPALGKVTFPNGWASVDLTIGRQTVRVVTTHLEPNDPAVQVAQGNELLAGPLNTSLPLILIGDLNSAAGGIGATPGQTDTPTYANIIAAGFTDAWSQANGDVPGPTCCHAADLRNTTSSLTERDDVILSRGLTASSVRLVGEVPSDRTSTGLWPSDHAGIVGILHLTRKGR
jgi:hypothetical protein